MWTLLIPLPFGSAVIYPPRVGCGTSQTIRSVLWDPLQNHPLCPAGPEAPPSSEDRAAAGESVSEAELRRLPEFNPPSFMPFGNVGTPLSVFLELIRACRLPPRVISKLQLDFPKTGSSRRYGNVPFEYQDTETVAEEERVYTAAGDELMEGEEPAGVTQPARPEEDEEGQEKEEEESNPDDVSGIFQHCPSSAVGAVRADSTLRAHF